MFSWVGIKSQFSQDFPYSMKKVVIGVFLFLFLVMPVSNLFAGVEKKKGSESGFNIETPIEKEHRPVIQAPGTVKKSELFWVSIQVGDRMHPVTDMHYIQWIEGFLNGELIFKIELTSHFAEPRLMVPLRLEKDSELKIEAHCNEYGTWGREISIRTR